ncbi:hypothetical protein ONS95_013971 [Cadophora gregata]|uniref:uncharacterized protein n=1 Tax=Cadophora gregata TaxID=51156 RepID=UPI0026DD1414|nr:uncharacterized protein ONS95_013971 [Cadophora gregata]KAK0113723.1 hypothetical protein ONS96_014578 [Cadophora gregata f. sp. sojae]KAK0114480.1 hypothetical protein ONS95_013971 [Cadophora gregata]
MVEESNFQLFRDCLSTQLIENSTTSTAKKPRRARAGRKNAIKPVNQTDEPNDAEELGEFIDYLATEIFANLPADLRTMTYSIWLNTPSLQAKYSDPLPTSTNSNILGSLPQSIADTLTTYSLLPVHKTTDEYLNPVLSTYINTLLTPPPPPRTTSNQATECEICGRSWISLTYHHLIPKSVHAKVLKRGWHTEDQLENVAWLCRACHSFVHRVANGEELAKDFFTVESLVEREDVRRFAEWVGRVRWKAR